MPRRGENIYKRKDGRWEGRYIKGYNENGKALYKSVYAHNYADIKSKLNQHFCQNAEIKNNNILLSAYADQWLNSVKLGRKISTYNKYRSIYDLHIKPFIGNCRIGYICNDHIDKIIAACSELSPKTVNDILCVVKMLFEYIRINGGNLNICMKGLGIRQEYIYTVGFKMVFLGDRLAINRKDIVSCTLECVSEIPELSEHKADSMLFSRSPRTVEPLFEDVIEIEGPPTLQKQRNQPLIFVVGPSVTMPLPILLSTFINSQFIAVIHSHVQMK